MPPRLAPSDCAEMGARLGVADEHALRRTPAARSSDAVTIS